MRKDLWGLFERFCRHEIEVLAQAYPRDAAGRLPDLDTSPKAFHEMSVGLAMYRGDFPLVNLPASMTDGFGDFSIDAIALMYGAEPAFSAEEAEELLETQPEKSVLRIMFVQAKREEKIDEKEVSDFRVKVQRFLKYAAADIEKQLSIGVEGRQQEAAEAVLNYWRAYDVLRRSGAKIEVTAIYAFSGDYTSPAGVEAVISEFEEGVTSSIPGAKARLLIYGADELLAIGSQADADVTRCFSDTHVVDCRRPPAHRRRISATSRDRASSTPSAPRDLPIRSARRFPTRGCSSITRARSWIRSRSATSA